MESPPKATKKRKVRSWVWEHFKPSTSEVASCNHCGELVSIINGTNRMKNHLMAHGVLKPETTLPSEVKKIKTENPLQQVITTKLYVSLILFNPQCCMLHE